MFACFVSECCVFFLFVFVRVALFVFAQGVYLMLVLCVCVLSVCVFFVHVRCDACCAWLRVDVCCVPCVVPYVCCRVLFECAYVHVFDCCCVNGVVWCIVLVCRN